MNTIDITDLIYAGSFAVDSGQAIVGDPCYLHDYDPNTNDEWNLEGKIGEYSYQGISATTLSDDGFGEVGGSNAVAFRTGWGDGLYPVYVKRGPEGTISMVVIDFDGELEDN